MIRRFSSGDDEARFGVSSSSRVYPNKSVEWFEWKRLTLTIQNSCDVSGGDRVTARRARVAGASWIIAERSRSRPLGTSDHEAGPHERTFLCDVPRSRHTCSCDCFRCIYVEETHATCRSSATRSRAAHAYPFDFRDSGSLRRDYSHRRSRCLRRTASCSGAERSRCIPPEVDVRRPDNDNTSLTVPSVWQSALADMRVTRAVAMAAALASLTGTAFAQAPAAQGTRAATSSAPFAVEEATIAGTASGHPPGADDVPSRGAGVCRSRACLQRRLHAARHRQRNADPRRRQAPCAREEPLAFPTATTAVSSVLPNLEQYAGLPIEFGRMEPTKSDPSVQQQFGMVVGIPNAGQVNALSTLNLRGERSVTCKGAFDAHPSTGPLPAGLPRNARRFAASPTRSSARRSSTRSTAATRISRSSRCTAW